MKEIKMQRVKMICTRYQWKTLINFQLTEVLLQRNQSQEIHFQCNEQLQSKIE